MLVKRNSNQSVTSVTVTALPVLLGAPEGKQDGFGFVKGSGPNLERRGLKPLKVVDRENVLRLLEETPAGKVPRSLKEDEWRMVQAAHSLKNAIQGRGAQKDELELQRAFNLLGIAYPEGSRGGSSQELWELVALDRLTEIVSAGRLIFWIDDRDGKGQLSPGIYCPTLKAAVIVSALFGDSFNICPRCRTVFFGNKTYCKTACETAHRVARWRARQKNKNRRTGHAKRSDRKT
jgi:uncharacterized C2H2 Zn-finger protein